jgi:hypothetical protein
LKVLARVFEMPTFVSLNRLVGDVHAASHECHFRSQQHRLVGFGGNAQALLQVWQRSVEAAFVHESLTDVERPSSVKVFAPIHQGHPE